ncbi:MAG TPA: GNAT family N-acetyltransferase [Phycisphaerales bacterium]|nr:GNAT family N-acetyltransferase [Phycisphaerales bacterium]
MPAHADLAIRTATPDDIPLILHLIRELADYERDPAAAVATPELLRRHLFGDSFAGQPHLNGETRRGPVAECLIGEVDGAPQGFALFFHNFSTWRGQPGLYLEDLFVRPAARGRGLGKALLIELARIAHARGCGRMEWAVLDWNTPAIDFYKALGAKPMDEWTTYRVDAAGIARLASEPGAAPCR